MHTTFLDRALLKHMDGKTKASVRGFLRRHADSLWMDGDVPQLVDRDSTALSNIPEFVALICMTYFYSAEFLENPQPGIVISSNWRIARSLNSHGWRSVYGRNRVPSLCGSRVVWTVKVSLDPQCWYIVGVTSNVDTQCTDRAFQRNIVDANYAYYMQCDESFSRYKGSPYGSFKKFANCKEVLVSIELDLRDGRRSLSISLQDRKSIFGFKKSQGVLCDDVEVGEDMQYALGISLYGNATAEILNMRVDPRTSTARHLPRFGHSVSV